MAILDIHEPTYQAFKNNPSIGSGALWEMSLEEHIKRLYRQPMLSGEAQRIR